MDGSGSYEILCENWAPFSLNFQLPCSRKLCRFHDKTNLWRVIGYHSLSKLSLLRLLDKYWMNICFFNILVWVGERCVNGPMWTLWALALSWFLPSWMICLYLLLFSFSLNPPRDECASTVWRMWTRPFSSWRSRESILRTWGPTTSWMETTGWPSASSGPSSCASR